MKIDVFFTPAELRGAESAAAIVVIDVLRATSTIVEALDSGARAIFPVATAEDAAVLAQSLGRDQVLLCGERNGLPIEGFDLGNAPAEFTEAVADKALVMTTTNGTRALLTAAERGGGAEGGPAIVVAAYLNLSAVVDRLAELDGPVAFLCAGREGRFALEDAHLAGAIIRGLEARGVEVEANDAAVASRQLAESAGAGAKVVEVLESTAAGRRLAEIGRAEDLPFCARVDRSDQVPVLRERKITVS